MKKGAREYSGRFNIFLVDSVTLTSDFVEVFSGVLSELRNRLKELQSGYCEDELPRIKTKDGVIYSSSDSDYVYGAKL